MPLTNHYKHTIKMRWKMKCPNLAAASLLLPLLLCLSRDVAAQVRIVVQRSRFALLPPNQSNQLFMHLLLPNLQTCESTFFFLPTARSAADGVGWGEGGAGGCGVQARTRWFRPRKRLLLPCDRKDNGNKINDRFLGSHYHNAILKNALCSTTLLRFRRQSGVLYTVSLNSANDFCK